MKRVKLVKEFSATYAVGTIIEMEDNVAAAALKAGTVILAGGNEQVSQLPAPQLKEDADKIAKEAKEAKEKADKAEKDRAEKEKAEKDKAESKR